MDGQNLGCKGRLRERGGAPEMPAGHEAFGARSVPARDGSARRKASMFSAAPWGPRALRPGTGHGRFWLRFRRVAALARRLGYGSGSLRGDGGDRGMKLRSGAEEVRVGVTM